MGIAVALFIWAVTFYHSPSSLAAAAAVRRLRRGEEEENTDSGGIATTTAIYCGTSRGSSNNAKIQTPRNIATRFKPDEKSHIFSQIGIHSFQFFENRKVSRLEGGSENAFEFHQPKISRSSRARPGRRNTYMVTWFMYMY